MRERFSNFHSVVAASLAVSVTILLSGASPNAVQAQNRLPDPVQADPAQDLPDQPSPPILPGIASDDGPAVPPGTPGTSADDMDGLFAELAQPEGEGWRRAESDILRNWSRSGSAAMDLLYKRGEAAIDGGDMASAIGHLTALTDHAPQFASGWHLRSVALYLDGDFGPAISDLARTLELEPRHFLALTQLGSMLEDVGEDERALTAYRESLTINPHQQEALDAVQRLEAKTAGTDA